jgi:anaerobic magnesium-protoporphyrin IX monomethyl ester cyclase
MGKEAVLIIGGFEGGALSRNNPPRAALEIASATSGFKPVVFHANRIGESWPEFLPRDNFPLTGVSISTWNEWCQLPEIVAKIKNRTLQTITVIGGKYPTFFPRETLQIPGVDILVRGYGDKAWETLTGYLHDGKPIQDLEEEGIYRAGQKLPEDDKLTLSPPIPLRDLPQPSYGSLVPKVRSYVDRSYSDLKTLDEKKTLLMDASFSPNILSGLGCPYDCTFCVNTLLKREKNFGRSPVELRPPSLIAEEIGLLQRETSVSEIPVFLINPDSTLDPDHLVLTMKEFERRGIQALVGVDVRIHSLYQALSERPDLELEKNLKGKLFKIILAPETLHSETQITIGKQTDPDELLTALYFCGQIGALPIVQIIVGFPVDNYDSLRYTLEKILEIRDQSEPFVLNVHRATPFPGTTFFNEARRLGFIDQDTPIPDMTVGPSVVRSQFLSPEELDMWKKSIITAFYSPEYMERIKKDPRPRLLQEAINCQRRGFFGESNVT